MNLLAALRYLTALGDYSALAERRNAATLRSLRCPSPQGALSPEQV